MPQTRTRQDIDDTRRASSDLARHLIAGRKIIKQKEKLTCSTTPTNR